jgi:hypothetical protein
MSIYKGQSLIKITLETGQDLTEASAVKILYKKPDGTKGSWTATTNGTAIEYNVVSGNIDQEGSWQLQSEITISGRTGYGQVTMMKVEPPLK